MKKYIAIILSAVCILGFSLHVAATEIINYTFDGNDELNTVTNTLAEGGNALVENGVLALNSAYGINLGSVGESFTVTAMVNVSSIGGTETIFFKNMGDASAQKWTGVISDNGIPAIWTHGDGNSWNKVVVGNKSVTGSWVHVAYSENNGIASLYVDGNYIGSGEVVKGAGQLYMGVTYWSGDAISATVDNVVLFDYVLSDSEVKKQHEANVKYYIDIPRITLNDVELTQSVGSTEVVWESSDENVITTDGNVIRGSEDKTVTLTAKVNGKEVATGEVLVLKRAEKLDDRVILSYNFKEIDNGIVRDQSVNGNDAVAYNNLICTNEGAAFDGKDDYVELCDGVLSGYNEVTIVTKFKPEGAQKNVALYTFGNTTETGYVFLNPSGVGTNLIRFAATKTNGEEEREIASLPGIRHNEWATVVVTLSGSDAAMYVNGEMVMDGNIDMLLDELGETQQNYIAKSLYASDSYFAGIVSEFTIYGYAMSESEIASLHKEPVQYASENEKEEYITEISFENGIDVKIDNKGRNDVKLGVMVFDESGNCAEVAVASSSDELKLTKDGNIIVFAFNEIDNIPGKIYARGNCDGFAYEYTQKGFKLISQKDYSNGVLLVAGYDTNGVLVSVCFKECDINPDSEVILDCNFTDTVTYKVLYWGD